MMEAAVFLFHIGKKTSSLILPADLASYQTKTLRSFSGINVARLATPKSKRHSFTYHDDDSRVTKS